MSTFRRRSPASPLRASSLGLGLLAAAAFFAPSYGCVAVPDQGKAAPIATHVIDWRDEVIYQAIIDRFANGDINNDYGVKPGHLGHYQGGDWKGLEDKLDYLQQLGVTTVWISPVVKNVESDAGMDGYHGYWAQDLSKLNPHFGDLPALRSMVNAAHARGMKIVLDIVTNHMGQVFFYDINMNGEPDVYVAGSGLTENRKWAMTHRCTEVTITDPSGNNTKNTVCSPSALASIDMQRVTEYDPDYDPRGIQAGQPWQPNSKLAGRAPIYFINDPSVNRVRPGPGILGTLNAYHGMGRIIQYDLCDDYSRTCKPDEPLANTSNQNIYGDFPGGLKDVRTEDPDVRATMVDSYARWAELADLDGFRIDTVKHVEMEFWEVFPREVRERLEKKGKTNFMMFGEAWSGDDAFLQAYTQENRLDSVFYFPQHYSVFQSVFVTAHTYDPSKPAGQDTKQAGTNNIEGTWIRRDSMYGKKAQPKGTGIPPYKALINFLDNHDVARFLFDAEGDQAALRNAITLQFTEQGIPCIYYGTEQNFNGGNDPANRETLWLPRPDQPPAYDTNNETFRHYAKVASVRRKYEALRRGDTHVVYSTGNVRGEDDAGLFAFERAGGDAGTRYALVVMNTNGRHKSGAAIGNQPIVENGTPTGTKKLAVAAGTTLVDVLNPGKSYAVGPDGTVRVDLEAQTSAILVPADQVVPQ